MIPTLPTNLLKPGNSIENNALSASVGVDEGSSGKLFKEKFSSAMKHELSQDGKSKPLNFTALKDLEIQDLVDLEGLGDFKLLPQSGEIKSLSIFSMLGSEDANELENIDLFGNPDANALLKTTDLISDDLLEEDILNKSINKSDLRAGKVITGDVLQQSIDKKSGDVVNLLEEIDFSKYIKDLGKSDTDSGSKLLTQLGRQEINTVKLADQLASLDKPISAITTPGNNSIKSYAGTEQSGAMLQRIGVPVTQTGWGDALGNRLMMMVNGKVQSANIHLNPAELGPIEIRVNLNHDHAAVHFVSNNSMVRDAIEDAFPRLKDMFMQNGISLTDANVSQQSSSHQGNAYSNEQAGSSAEIDDGFSDINEVQPDNHRGSNSLLLPGMVDQYV